MFKVYKRKIDVYRQSNELDGKNAPRWVYVWSSNSYRTRKDAIAAATAKHPAVKFTAAFVKD